MNRSHLHLALWTALGAVATAAADGPRFDEIASRAGIAFLHEHGGTGTKYMVETVGSGVCFLDYDGDGDADLYLVQGAAMPGFEPGRALRNALYRNEGPGPEGLPRFVEVTDKAGVGDDSWGMGCAAADIDGDADLDLLVTNFGPDVLYRNEGDGRFTDVTSAAGLGDPRWTASAAFGDADGDGSLDLYITGYVDFTIENHRACGAIAKGMVSYCHPEAYQPIADLFYRNRGDGTFRNATADLGTVRPGNGLGVLWSDLDDDGRLDIFVANDATPNFLFHNSGDGIFRETALVQGVAVNEDGNSESGMGVESADFDGDGWFDLFVTHLDTQTNTLYRNLGKGRFLDWSIPSGVAQPSLLHVGFGTAAIDFDLDADLDLIVTNGHVLDNVTETHFSTVTYPERMHLLVNDGTGRFREAGRAHGEIFEELIVGRGLAVADLEHDGDLDVAVTESRGPARLLLSSGAEGRWIQVDLEQPGPNRNAVGAKVTIGTDARLQLREVRSGSSYLSQNALTLHAGLGGGSTATLEVRWPDGAHDRFRDLPADRRYRLRRASAGPIMEPPYLAAAPLKENGK